MIEFLLGVDGGGSGTRACLARAVPAGGGAPAPAPAGAAAPAGACAHTALTVLATGTAGPSALSLGVERAWAAVEQAVAAAFAGAGLPPAPRSTVALGLGLAGVHHRLWAAQFAAADPGYGRLALASDGYTTVLGAHDGAPGAIIALGTGSVGEVRLADGCHVEVGGWGFPSGDEAGGAWIGLHAINHLQHSFDGRLAPNAFADAVAQACGLDPDATRRRDPAARELLQQWLAGAAPARYAQLAPVVLRHAADSEAAHAIVQAAGAQVARIAAALDAGGTLPLALCGGLAAPLHPYLPPALQARVVAPRGDSAAGALRLIRQHLDEAPR
ncbi:ATPase [Duganella sp. Leaf126]|uniref:BadF/BadG/BcrA/BcrD ATPase family protein n=1 Tax=Duganella sp. Leaf126 TaxID=1736266 RepID=UPI0006F66A61|nr:BadF/BadG/BcrA/BcrD ATPase family protein [Duganella sp. Leaf126]KQQ45333.1 ATPase [Duganella sp. Leaf126]